MKEREAEHTVFGEVARRRARSAGLQARAIERGIAVHQAQEKLGDPEPSPDAEEKLERDSIVSFVSFDDADSVAGSDGEPMQQLEDELESASVAKAETNEAIAFEEKPENESEAMGATSPDDAASLEPEELETEVWPTEDPAEILPPVESIAQSPPILQDEPQMLEDSADDEEAERLASLIGPVVDIQRLPKTKPNRVLSKSAAQSGVPRAEQKPSPKRFEKPTPAPAKPVEPAPEGSAEGDAAKKGKRKRISLLDSYFKGL